MKYLLAILASLTLTLCLSGCDVFEKQISGDYHITWVTVIDATGADAYVADVTITAGQIVAIHDLSQYDTIVGETIDGTGKFLIPGLWDMHVHLAADGEHPEALNEFINSGVTTIRDAGGHIDVLKKWQAEIDQGSRTGPRMFMVGPTLNGEAFADFQVEVTTPAEGARMVRELAGEGVDGIKVHRAIAPDVLKAVVETAHSLGLKVSGHLPLGSPPEIACQTDMDSVEHLGSFLESYISVHEGDQATMAASLGYLMSPDADTLLDCLANQNIAVTPTVVIYPYIAKSRGTEEMVELGRQTVAAMQKILARFREHGIMLMAGTDTPLLETGMPFGESLIEELEILKGAGYSNLEVLQIATRNPATFMGVYGETGSIEEGKRADLVLLDANPLDDISNLRSVEAVFVNGKRVK